MGTVSFGFLGSNQREIGFFVSFSLREELASRVGEGLDGEVIRSLRGIGACRRDGFLDFLADSMRDEIFRYLAGFCKPKQLSFSYRLLMSGKLSLPAVSQNPCTWDFRKAKCFPPAVSQYSRRE